MQLAMQPAPDLLPSSAPAELFAALIESAPDAIFVKDLEGRYQAINPAGAAMLGCLPADVIGRTDAELMEPETLRRTLESDAAALCSDTLLTYETEGIYAGVPRTLFSSKGRVRDPRGRVVGVFGIARDITRRKRAEERLALTQAVTAGLCRALTPAQVAEVIIAEVLPAVGASAGAVLELDRATGDLVLLRARGYPFHIEERLARVPPLPRCPLTEVARTGLPLFVDSADIWMDASAPPPAAEPESWAAIALPGEGPCAGALAISFREHPPFDESERQFIETLGHQCGQALQRAHGYQAAMEMVRALEQQLEMVSHDLRNPLQVIALSGRMLARGRSEPAVAAETILRSAERMGRLIDDLVGSGNAQSGLVELSLVSLKADELIEGAARAFCPLAAGTPVEVRCGEVATGVCVSADRDRILQVFSNLIGNALRFTEEGSVTLSSRLYGEEVVFSVVDTGPGIPPIDLPRIFDRYYQADPSSAHHFGLGLSIAKGIVEAHGGRIWAESRAGEGASIFFTVQRSPAKGSGTEDLIP
jgi:PAS domain S-box-containing protein